MSELAYIEATVYGHVKGVYYRAFTSQLAKSLGLRGYVRNSPQMNAVEITVEGPKEKLENLVTWAKSGPPLARIENVKIDWQKETGEFSDFSVRFH